jgi:hypothetical protein
VSFLSHLEKERHNGASSSNVRLCGNQIIHALYGVSRADGGLRKSGGKLIGCASWLIFPRKVSVVLCKHAPESELADDGKSSECFSTANALHCAWFGGYAQTVRMSIVYRNFSCRCS